MHHHGVVAGVGIDGFVCGKLKAWVAYAVFFEGSEPLDGTNSQTSERIIAIAKYNYETPISSTQYTRTALPFVYRKAVPQGVPLQYTIIASSSSRGDYFEGAADSQLFLDKVEIKLRYYEK